LLRDKNCTAGAASQRKSQDLKWFPTIMDLDI
jgi:hypothetical protein